MLVGVLASHNLTAVGWMKDGEMDGKMELVTDSGYLKMFYCYNLSTVLHELL